MAIETCVDSHSPGCQEPPRRPRQGRASVESPLSAPPAFPFQMLRAQRNVLQHSQIRFSSNRASSKAIVFKSIQATSSISNLSILRYGSYNAPSLSPRLLSAREGAWTALNPDIVQNKDSWRCCWEIRTLISHQSNFHFFLGLVPLWDKWTGSAGTHP